MDSKMTKNSVSMNTSNLKLAKKMLLGPPAIITRGFALLLVFAICVWFVIMNPVSEPIQLIEISKIQENGKPFFSPYVPRSLCQDFVDSASLFSNISTNYTSYYPHNSQIFENEKQSQQICSDIGDVQLLIAITSRPEDFHKRSAIRETYADKYSCQDSLYTPHKLTCNQVWARVRLVFFVGRSKKRHRVNQLLHYESDAYADVVHLTKFERYDDLSVKTLSILHWVSQFCQQAQFLAKVDDDSLINLANLLSVVDNYAQSPLQHSHFIAGQLNRRPKLNRNPKSSYYTPESVLPNSYDVPHYSFGCGYLMPTRTAQLLYQAGRCVPSISIEDLYITGLLRQSLNVSLVSQACINCFQLSVNDTVRDFDVLNILHHVRAPTMREIWQLLLQRTLTAEYTPALRNC